MVWREISSPLIGEKSLRIWGHEIDNYRSRYIIEQGLENSILVLGQKLRHLTVMTIIIIIIIIIESMKLECRLQETVQAHRPTGL
jgi:hypothetical protein